MRKVFNKNKKAKKLLYFLAVFFFFVNFSAGKVQAQELDFGKSEKRISFQDEGMLFESLTNAQTVQDFLNEKKINLKDKDVVFPNRSEKIFSGSKIIVHRAKKITIKEGGETREIFTLQKTIQEAIWEDGEIELDQDDIIVPVKESLVKDGVVVSVTHVLIKEEIKNVNIDFKTISNENDELGWREKKVTQKGEVGTKEVKYKVVFNDGKEISRKVLESKTIKEPVEEIVTQGTKVKVGKVHTGIASWYAWTGTMAAANPWLPMGSYVRVTNTENGKSVIVKINDRGPFGPGRIIDLDKVAFAKIASIGAGVVNVKMEVITN